VRPAEVLVRQLRSSELDGKLGCEHDVHVSQVKLGAIDVLLRRLQYQSPVAGGVMQIELDRIFGNPQLEVGEQIGPSPDPHHEFAGVLKSASGEVLEVATRYREEQRGWIRC